MHYDANGSMLVPSGNILVTGTTDTQSQLSDQPRPRYVQVVQRMIFETPEEGIYRLDISYQGKLLGGAPFAVEFIKTEAEQNVNVGS
jgi:hypothetical protein